MFAKLNGHTAVFLCSLGRGRRGGWSYGTCVVPALGKIRREDQEIETPLRHVVRGRAEMKRGEADSEELRDGGGRIMPCQNLSELCSDPSSPLVPWWFGFLNSVFLSSTSKVLLSAHISLYSLAAKAPSLTFPPRLPLKSASNENFTSLF